MTALRTLLVHLDGSPRSATRLRLARTLAADHEATLTAMLAVTPAYVSVPLSYLGDAGGAVLLQEAEAERRRGARRLFDQECAQPGPDVRWTEAVNEMTTAAFAGQALYADLMVLGQRDPGDAQAWGVPPDFVPTAMEASGRAALVVPYAGEFKTVGRDVLVAWKPTRESARAITAAVPLMQAARRVQVVTWGEAGQTGTGSTGLSGFLAAHGIQARVTDQGPEPKDVGEMLLSRAADLGSDLLVMGCYGHTRARELLLGGATRTVLRSMTVPVLMAH